MTEAEVEAMDKLEKRVKALELNNELQTKYNSENLALMKELVGRITGLSQQQIREGIANHDPTGQVPTDSKPRK